ncbi:hypothetical protein [Aestuariimicrobium sp. T2.26MG-19.2B]|uniref:hypothetical protein n=1 Tax=Aestuariimicrobium sp. T2.26MG-19.2B TaxID=3040679 RepID=UPI002477A7B3|nr:hypothetical protein [Aestuariimicrobium sp. T2.26MG-19.2B]CAI9411610.1 hypothetical protein AESSP_02685 [Aestuariimicrobium sp. T2.26MG-19.2B]
MLLETAPEFGELVTIIAWAKWIGLTICLGALIVGGGQLAHAHGRGDHSNLKGIGMVAVAALVISLSAAIVNAALA